MVKLSAISTAAPDSARIKRVHFPLCVRLIPQNPRDYGG